MNSIHQLVRRLEKTVPTKIKIFFPNYNSTITDCELIEELFGVTFEQCIYFDSQSLRQAIATAAEKGFHAVVGGTTTLRFASQYNIAFQEVVTPGETIMETIDNARAAALSNREEKNLRKRYQTLMDLTSDGIIAVDPSGFITAMNKQAQEFLQIQSKDASGKASTATHIASAGIRSALKQQTQIQDKIEKIGNRLFVYNQQPIALKGHTTGVMATFKEADTVMRAENKVRQQLTRGFQARYTIEDMVCQSPTMQHIIRTAKKLAKTNSGILITGHTGTGKEILAQSIHTLSSRKKKAFVSVHCAALPEQLLESELFGYEEGAFTGSKKGGKAGLFELAHQGTLFLDEIDSTPHSVQLRLLRVLQEKEVMRIGADRKIPVDVRVLAAAGKDLWSAVEKGDFRNDLFFRLNVLHIALPPLAERKSDIPVLLEHFLQYHAQKHGLPLLKLPADYIRQLTEYSWPGNVRQLRHFAEQLLLTSSFQPLETTFTALLTELTRIAASPPHCAPSAQEGTDPAPQQAKFFSVNTYKLSAETIKNALLQTHFSRTKAAALLGISRTTLWRKIKEYNLHKP